MWKTELTQASGFAETNEGNVLSQNSATCGLPSKPVHECKLTLNYRFPRFSLKYSIFSSFFLFYPTLPRKLADTEDTGLVYYAQICFKIYRTYSLRFWPNIELG